MKTSSRIFSILLAVALMLGFFPVHTPLTTHAAVIYPQTLETNYEYVYESLGSYLRTQLYNVDAFTQNDDGTYSIKLGISQYRLKLDDFGAFYDSFKYQYTDLFFLAPGCSYYQNGTYVTSIIFTLDDTPLSVKNRMIEFNSKAEKIVAEAELLETDLEKALYVHDVLANNNRYSADVLNNVENYDTVVHNAYSAIVNGETVCQGYSYAYKYLLNRLGIMAEIVTSDTMSHAWNIVSIDALWYHVDITWDDPAWDMIGRVNHDFFLNSHETAAAKYIESGISSAAAVWNDINTTSQTTTNFNSNTDHENRFFRTLTAPVSHLDGTWYYTTGNYSYIEVMSTDDITAVEVTGKQLAKKPTYQYLTYKGEEGYVYASTPSAVAIYGNKIYYSNYNTIFCADPDGSNEKEIFNYAQPDRNHCVYGVRIADGVLYYSIISKHEGGPVQREQIPLNVTLENNRYVDSTGIIYTLNSDGTATIGNGSDLPGAGYNGSQWDLTVPAAITVDGKEYTVSAIDENAFVGHKYMTITFEGAQPEVTGQVFEAGTVVYFYASRGWTISGGEWSGATATNLDAPTKVQPKDDSLTIVDGELCGVTMGTTVDQILTMLEGEYEICTTDLKKISSGRLGTGYTISRVVNGIYQDTVTVVIPGDIVSDGRATSKDIIALKLHLNNTYAEYTYQRSLDVNGDGVVNGADADALAELVFTD